MKLSEAIREGAKLRPQAYRDYFKEGGSCALGAAYEITHGQFEFQIGGSISVQLDNDFPALNAPYVDHVLGEITIRHAITTRNDNLHWTREQIADWLEAQGF